jgi:hypothetical protein
LESARAPDALVGKADEPAVGDAFDAASLFILVPTRLALTDRVAANFEVGCLVAAGCFALAFVMGISDIAGHPSRPTAAAPQWPRPAGQDPDEPIRSLYSRSNAPLPQQSQFFS